MTPMDLLEEVKRRFSPLIVVDPVKLEGYLRQALRTYRDRAGVIRNIDTSERVIVRPANALELIGVSDDNGNYVDCRESRDDVEGETLVRWHLLVDSCYKGHSKPPYRICYLLDLEVLDFENDPLPRGIVSLLGDYLECLIDIENTRRFRMAGGTAEIQVESLRSDTELLDRKTALELEMQETAEMLPMMVVI
ncbi:MAG: hypothetical protein IBX50_04235 [Marinospirillum sp.]|uniref:hypothetical protein n=1 Tax=Marinospirillum sp. TaxID=2183934 RepID=UPI001A09569F|nr:hypothetical protein [Marinospirillum sp.]MBE0505915.1 hypothetical protein [Marinospirillum sp.]